MPPSRLSADIPSILTGGASGICTATDVAAASACWYVYILRCADSTLYTGVTTDPARRLEEHNRSDRLGAKYTRTRRPVALVYQEDAVNRSAACKREAAIKKLSRPAKQRLISAAGREK